MYARLVTTASTTFSANVFFNTIVGVVTGSITANTQLDPTTFNIAASQVTNTVPGGWSIIDPVANTVANNYALSGCAPVVIQAPWTDSGSNYKVVWMGQTNFANNTVNIVGVPMESWSNTTKTGTNMLVNPNTISGNNAAFVRRWHDIVSPTGNFITGNGFVTIVSSSQAHLFVANYNNLTGSSFNNYFYLSEYSRDDPWSTVSNGYPSWFVEGTSNAAGSPLEGTLTGSSNGVLMRIYNTSTAADSNLVNISTTAGSFNWGLASRFWPFATSFNYRPYGLGFAASSTNFQGNQNYYRDINKQAASTISEIRVVATGVGATLTSNTMFAGGSINSVAPYIYLFRSQWLSLDEVDYGGNRYVNLILNNQAAASVGASTILLKEV